MHAQMKAHSSSDAASSTHVMVLAALAATLKPQEWE